jgi:hypothetical protein
MNWKLVNKIFRDLNLHPDQKKHLNCLRFHPTESKVHSRMKYDIVRECFKKSIPFLTEAWTENRKRRFDIVKFIDNEDEQVIEIETNERVTKEGAKTIKVRRD